MRDARSGIGGPSVAGAGTAIWRERRAGSRLRCDITGIPDFQGTQVRIGLTLSQRLRYRWQTGVPTEGARRGRIMNHRCLEIRMSALWRPLTDAVGRVSRQLQATNANNSYV